MNVVEKSIECKDAIGVNLKRAPSAGTVAVMSDNNMWERSQSDANLSIRKESNVGERPATPSVSDDPRVYWDLSRPEHSAACGVIPVVTTSTIGGFQLALETIHQHEEVLEPASPSPISTNNDDVAVTPPQHRSKRGGPVASMEHLPIHGASSMSSQSSNPPMPSPSPGAPYAETRRSCSALPTVFRRRSGGGVGPRAAQPPPPCLDTAPANYFCESDFDDSRERIPSCQSRLGALQDELGLLLARIGGIDRSAPFQSLPSDAEGNLGARAKVLARCSQLLREAWSMPHVGRDIATALCDLMRQQGLLTYLTGLMAVAGEVVTAAEHSPDLEARRHLVLVAAELFSQMLTSDNLDHILGLASGNSTPKKDDTREFLATETVSQPVQLFKEVVRQSWLVRADKELNREFIAILEAMLKHHEDTNRLVVQSGGLRSLIYSCRSTDNLTLRHVAFALVNLGLFGDSDVQMTMAHYKVADWLFPLAFNTDDIIKYYACLAIVVLSAHKELTQIIHSSGTIELVFTFIKTHSPYEFAQVEPSHCQGRSSTWLQRLLPLLGSDSVEAVTLASFHFVMEARIKQRQGKTRIFKDIGAIEVLRSSASSIHRVAAQFSRQALKILGIPPPFSLCHPAPIWSTDDVSNWLQHIGFADLCPRFLELNVDGDILLSIDDSIMRSDLGLTNGIVRLRLLRDINKLKSITTYETCDPSGVNDWLRLQVGPEYSQYTYALIKAGIDRKFLVDVTDEMLECDCSIGNSVHRTRILNAVEACKVKYQRDSQYSINSPTAAIASKPPTAFPRTVSVDKPSLLSCDHCVLSNHADDSMFIDDKLIKNIDVFISYRRSNGAQLASLIMVHLRLRGYRVFLDIERLPAGKFNENLLQSIQRSKNFLIVLTPNALDRCTDDVERKDWIHREIVCAMESKCNIIPITDRFVFPREESLPKDMKSIVNYNAVNWVHDYQDACVDKIEQFIKNSDYQCPFSPPPQLRASPALKPSQYAPSFIDNLLSC